MTVLTTCFSSSVSRVVASNSRRRSSSGPRSSLSKTERICADGERDRDFAQRVECRRAGRCFVAAGVSFRHAVELLEAEATPTAEAATTWVAAGLTVRALRGEKMYSTGALMDELSAALQFRTTPALSECLADMDWLLPTAGIVVLIRNDEQVLIEEPLEELEALVTVIGKASREYAEPIERGEWWDRPAVPFTSSFGPLVPRPRIGSCVRAGGAGVRPAWSRRDAAMNDPTSDLMWLCEWFANQCDGDWEHEFGISLETLDNPGWSLRIDLPRTALSERVFSRRRCRGSGRLDALVEGRR
jgi:hypothetical protein